MITDSQVARFPEAGNPVGEAGWQERELAPGVAGGAPESMGAVYDQYGAVLHRVLYAILGSVADAEDALQEVFARHPHIGPVLPAIGYTAEQLEALAETIRRVKAEVVVAATPVDLARLVAVDTPIVRARYEFAEAGEPGLGRLVDDWLVALPFR